MKQRLISFGVMALLLVLVSIVPVLAQDGISNFDAITTIADVVAGDDVSVTDDAAVGDDLTVAGDVILTAPTRAVIVNQGTLAPVTANVPISSAGAVGLTSITCGAGKVYRVVNVGAQNILITDTATMKLTANFTLGNLDNITLIGDGTNCIELARSNN